MFFSEHRLKMTSLRIGKHRIVKNIASLRKVNIAHPYSHLMMTDMANATLPNELQTKSSPDWIRSWV